MNDGYCPTCRAAPLITDFFPLCSRIPSAESAWKMDVKKMPEYQPDVFGARLSAEGVNRLGDTIAELRMQRDALLDTLEQIANESVRNLGSARIVARAAIAKVGDNKTANAALTGRGD